MNVFLESVEGGLYIPPWNECLGKYMCGSLTAQ